MAKFKENLKETIKILKTLSFKEKIEYIFQYYKLPIFSIIILIAIIVSMCIMLNANNYKSELTTLVVNGKMTGFDNNTDKLTTEFTKYLGIDGKKHRVIFNNNINMTKNSADEDTGFSIQKIILMSTSGESDGLLCDYDYVHYFSDEEGLFLINLTEVFSPDELTKLSDKLVYITTNQGSQIPVAVDLTNSRIKKDTDLSINRPCFGIISTSKHKDNAVQFIRYALDLSK